LTTKLTLTVTLTLNDAVKLISQTKLGGELLPERRVYVPEVVYTLPTIDHVHDSQPATVSRLYTYSFFFLLCPHNKPLNDKV